MPNSFRVVALQCVLLALASQVAARPASADLITNGSFESPVIAPGASVRFFGGSTAITGWTVVGSDVLLLQTTYNESVSYNNGMNAFNAQDGLNSVDVTGSGNTGPSDGLVQTVSTSVGQTYNLSFFVGRAQSDNGAPGYQDPTTVDLSIDGGPRVGYTNSNPAPPGYVGWEEFTTSFTATSPSTTIAFLNGTPLNTNFAGLDNVQLVASPEPSSVVLLAAAGLTLVARWRRFARAKCP